jgi:GGDEF domain-containing protein
MGGADAPPTSLESNVIRPKSRVESALSFFCWSSALSSINAARNCSALADTSRFSRAFSVAVYPEDGTTIDALFQAADRALYKMKALHKTA